MNSKRWPPAVREKDWQQVIIDAARLLGWSVFHPYDSRRSAPGFPDLTMVKGDRLVFVEVKTERGKETPAQESWSTMLALAGAEVYLWRPSHWDFIQDCLRDDFDPARWGDDPVGRAARRQRGAA